MFKNLTSGTHWSVTSGSSKPFSFAQNRRGGAFRRRRNSGEGVRPGEGKLGEEEGAREAHRAPGRHGGEVSNGGEVLGGVSPVSHGSGVGPWMIPTIPSTDHRGEHGIGSAMT